MSKAFGYDFVVISDVYQPLPSVIQTDKSTKYYHVATVRRGLKEYVAYVDPLRVMVWIEELDPTLPTLLKKIEDDNEWKDVRDFLWDKKLLEIGTRKEIPTTMETLMSMFHKKHESK